MAHQGNKKHLSVTCLKDSAVFFKYLNANCFNIVMLIKKKKDRKWSIEISEIDRRKGHFKNKLAGRSGSLKDT